MKTGALDILYKDYGSRGIIIDGEWLYFKDMYESKMTRAKKTGESLDMEVVLREYRGPINIYNNYIYYTAFHEDSIVIRKSNCDTGEFETIWKKQIDRPCYITNIILDDGYIFWNYYEVENKKKDATYFYDEKVKEIGVLK